MPRVTISEPGKTPQPYRFKLERTTINIGRGSDNDIIIECGSCSTHHCMMNRVEGGYILKDNESTNGIKQDDTLMDVIDLFDGMEVLVGDVPLKFRLSDEEIEVLAEEEFSTHQRKKLPPVDGDELEDEHRPSTESPRAKHKKRPAKPSSPAREALKTVIVLILMVVGVAVGMTVRHYKETKEQSGTGDFLPAKLMKLKK
ncbi:FHA domain-containing protein [Verrucomicrobiaceae bacterium N1E253]|uniref:FHA domain-containing protein n=1 Tax=Oceaniferula marina TaxID=2748318 RepID=A0A851GJK0_9BACT|nr:FHA domain-containing protein [Oceaniferula marina]NWK55277.1 FHA domain-containing protein [Oceaniferula marina]